VRTGRNIRLICNSDKANYFCEKGWTNDFAIAEVICPSGKKTRRNIAAPPKNAAEAVFKRASLLKYTHGGNHRAAARLDWQKTLVKMVMNSRRQLLRLGIFCTCQLIVPLARAQPLDGGCLVFSDESTSSARMPELVRTTGDRDMDYALDSALKRLADTLEVKPAFGFYDDGNSPNAFAYSMGEGGTVAFGKNYFRKWMGFDPTGLCVVAVLAHEFGHIMQIKADDFEAIKGGLATTKRVELHADYMSGYYIGRLRKEHPEASFWKAGDQIRQIGDYDVKAPDHHGTPAERVAASQQGFNVGFFEGKDAHFAYQSGKDYVSIR
jgi:hypothetical protein